MEQKKKYKATVKVTAIFNNFPGFGKDEDEASEGMCEAIDYLFAQHFKKPAELSFNNPIVAPSDIEISVENLVVDTQADNNDA